MRGFFAPLRMTGEQAQHEEMDLLRADLRLLKRRLHLGLVNIYMGNLKKMLDMGTTFLVFKLE
jgi:hypothetical protein